MPNITPTNSFNIDNELTKLDLYKYHANGILNISLNRLSDMLDGKIDVTEPSNPFTYLLETSSLNTAFAIQEYTLLTRKLYPRLANSEEDLYLHMSDYDYLGMFSEPAYGQVIFNILFNDFKTKASYDPVQKEYILKLPRHLKVTVDKYVFTLTSAIIIRLTDSEVIDVKFENQTFNNIFPVDTNYINFNIYKVNQNETYINFIIKLPEIDIEVAEIPIEKSKLFSNVLTFNPNRKFYFFRAFYMKAGVWKEMLVTHTNEVYDINTPTCIIKLQQNENSLLYYIPPVYINSNMIESKVKFLIYTTMGSINVNFSDFVISSFSTEYNPVFPDEELSVATEPLQLISKVIYLQNQIVDGKNGLMFTDLKNAVIDNSIGDRKLPITNRQNEFSILQNNFKVISNVDTVTNRIFLLESDIPKAVTRYPITKINLDIMEYATSISALKQLGNNISDVDTYTTLIPENTVFELTANGVRLLTPQEFSWLSNLSNIELVNEVNSRVYLSTMYHYVLDTSGEETALRPYNISSPVINQINFKELNSTTRVGVNTTNVIIVKSTTGYTINILANLKKYVSSISETNITPYIVYRSENGTNYYLEGRLYSSINNNPVFKFELLTNYHIDKFNKLNITNFKDYNNNPANVYIDINTKLELIYISNIIPINYVPSLLDNYIYNSYLSANNCVVTLEEISVKFADYLQYLYSQVHTSVGVTPYEVYPQDVPLRHTSTVYDATNVVINQPGDIVLDVNGASVIQYHAGDVMVDSAGAPISVATSELVRYINLLVMDYRGYVATKKNIVDYKQYIKDYLTNKIVVEANDVQGQLLENTEAFVVVPRNINITTVKTPYKVVNISCLQSFSVDVHVTNAVYKDTETRNNIEYTIISEVDNYLSNNSILTKTVLLDILYNKLKEYVKSVSISRFTELNDEYIEVLNPNYRIGLNKLLVLESDGYNLKEDVKISFHSV